MTVCKCGCGQTVVSGRKFRQGHWSRTATAKKLHASRRIHTEPENKTGLCMCGCGQKAPIAKAHHPERGIFKGKPVKYIKGHIFKTMLGEKHPHWKGGSYRSGGYVYRYAPEHPQNQKGYVMEHRLVMEKKLGRLLEKREKVHHINGKKTDNRIKNLVLISQADHIKLHGFPLDKWRKKHPKKARKHARKAGRKGAEARWEMIE